MIERVRIKNFKCYGEVGGDFNLSRINFIFGDNSAGKSTLLDFLDFVIGSFVGQHQYEKGVLDCMSHKECGAENISGNIILSAVEQGRHPIWDVKVDFNAYSDLCITNELGDAVSKEDVYLGVEAETGGTLIRHMTASRPHLKGQDLSAALGGMAAFEHLAELEIDPEIRMRANRLFVDLGIGRQYEIINKEYLKDLVFEQKSHLLNVGAGVHELFKTTMELAAWRGGILELEEPETHLNEKQLAPLMRVLVREALAHTGQMIVECHSELMFLELQNLLNHGDVAPEQVSVNVVEKTGNGSVVTGIPLDRYGNILKPWPGGFFNERVRITDAYYEDPS